MVEVVAVQENPVERIETDFDPDLARTAVDLLPDA
jgi:hypothetical protein